MEFFDNLYLVGAVVDKNLSADLVKEVADISPFDVTTFFGTTETNEKGLLGIQIKEDVDLVFCLVNELCVERTIETMTTVGRMDELGVGYCFVMPLSKVFMPGSHEGGNNSCSEQYKQNDLESYSSQ